MSILNHWIETVERVRLLHSVCKYLLTASSKGRNDHKKREATVAARWQHLSIIILFPHPPPHFVPFKLSVNYCVCSRRADFVFFIRQNAHIPCVCAFFFILFRNWYIVWDYLILCIVLYLFLCFPQKTKRSFEHREPGVILTLIII